MARCIRKRATRSSLAYLPGLSRGDLASIAIGIAGTIVAIVLAAATGSGYGA